MSAPESTDIYDFLDGHGLAYQRTDHPPVFTCEEADRWVPEMAAARTKNLFARDRKGKRHFLVVVGYEKQVDLAALGLQLGAGRLLLGSPERLQRLLGVQPGSVTILGLVHDQERQVEVVFDQSIDAAPALRCHPLRNDATLAISRSDIERFLDLTGHRVQVLEVPERKKEPAN